MTRKELLEQFGEPRPVLDHGHVRLIDFMGDDAAVVDMARKSYGKGTKATSDDETLLRYLMREYHSGPFEGVVVKLHVKCPIFVARQLMRHRTGSYDETSLRYSEAEDQFWLPDTFYHQSTDNKQGSGEAFADHDNTLLAADYALLYNYSYRVYKHALRAGVSREIARSVLPVATYTEYYFVMNLHNLLHLLRLRTHPHAQAQTRAFADAICDIVKAWLPQTWRAFRDYRLESMQLSRMEIEALSKLFSQMGLKATAVADDAEGMGRRELKEFAEKLKRLGFDT